MHLYLFFNTSLCRGFFIQMLLASCHHHLSYSFFFVDTQCLVYLLCLPNRPQMRGENYRACSMSQQLGQVGLARLCSPWSWPGLGDPDGVPRCLLPLLARPVQPAVDPASSPPSAVGCLVVSLPHQAASPSRGTLNFRPWCQLPRPQKQDLAGS